MKLIKNTARHYPDGRVFVSGGGEIWETYGGCPDLEDMYADGEDSVAVCIGSHLSYTEARSYLIEILSHIDKQCLEQARKKREKKLAKRKIIQI